ncbi:MAG: iron ABC transporter permease [Candidatus Cloacimonetes bacterium]|nr:iron ABC transporter permease [Candidatus Cloacimonadota bacterium]
MSKHWRVILLFALMTAVIYIYIVFGAASGYVIQHLRLPRLVLTMLVGMTLGSVGFAFQLLLNNPLAEPYILGVSSGAALASILAGAAGLFLLMPLFGFLGALAAMLAVYWLAQRDGMFNTTRLLLAGIIVGMFLSSIISLVMYLNQNDIGNIINILMGNLGHIFSNSDWQIFIGIAIICLVLLGWLALQGRRLLVLSTGDLLAGSLGLNVRRLRVQIFIVCSLLTGLTVAFSGIIGFVGLIVPHLVRLIWKGNKPESIFYAGVFGSVFLLICDFIAMHLAVIELPVGIVTSFIGCPLFIYLLWRKK